MPNKFIRTYIERRGGIEELEEEEKSTLVMMSENVKWETKYGGALLAVKGQHVATVQPRGSKWEAFVSQKGTGTITHKPTIFPNSAKAKTWAQNSLMKSASAKFPWQK